jgi:hypothetical protein
MDLADLNTLCHLADNKDYAWLTDYLSNPRSPTGTVFFSGPRDHFLGAVEDLRYGLSDVPEIKHLFDLFLITRFLLAPSQAPDWTKSWFEDQIEIDRHLQGIDKRRIYEHRFCAVPVVSVCGEAHIRYFITGLLKNQDETGLWPTWVDLLLDDIAKDTIHSAAEAAQRLISLPPVTSLYCYPLTTANGECQITGSSLGLSLAIGFMANLSDTPISNRLLATGSINKHGEINRVGNLDLKLRCAHREKFSVFLQPHQDLAGFPLQDLEAIPVADLSEAWLIASLYAPGRGHELLTFLQMLKNPNIFVNNMDHIDHTWVRWADRQKWEKVIKDITESCELLQDFVEKLDRVLKGWNLDAAGELSWLISRNMFQKMKSVSPLSAFRFCTLNLELSNHRGDDAAAKKWDNEGWALFPQALNADINACADFLNIRFVSRQNRYAFEPELPGKVADLLTCLEERYTVQSAGGCSTDPVLGRLCGSIAQNFAFCGAKYLSECEKYVHHAMQAFGNGKVPEYRNDYLRQFNYLVYARLDAGEIENARNALFCYLEVETWKDLRPRTLEKDLSAWHHAALARFLADSDLPVQKKNYFNSTRDIFEKILRNNHPWQLWLYNLGRIAAQLGFSDEAAKMYQKSIDLCLSDDLGHTVHVMALLPLKGLFELNRLKTNAEEAETAEKQIRQAAAMINPAYFSSLLGSDKLTGQFHKVAGHLQKYFPFSYR